MTADTHDVMVLLASRWSALERFDTRWRRVVMAWSAHPAVRSLTLIDHPWWTSPLTPTSHLVRPGASWLAGARLHQLKIPSGSRPALDPLAWRRVGRRLRPLAGSLVVATSPMVAPALRHVGGAGATTAFDGVDLWRMREVSGFPRARLDAGYAAGYAAHVVTAVSDTVARDMQADGARHVTAVPNGVALAEFAHPRPSDVDHLGLPNVPFAVYIGTIGHRLDLELLREVADKTAVPLVLVGQAVDADYTSRAAQGPWLWTGPVGPELIPAILARAATALLPFEPGLPVQAQDHMKLFQYLASGAPTVATPMNGLPDDVLVGETASEFAARIDEAARRPRRTTTHPLLKGRDWADVSERLLSLYTQRADA
ncbi:MAG: glycosyltransferase [Frankiales bacterium]|nr:glycosyltransferase [Frankiales bacterium]